MKRKNIIALLAAAALFLPLQSCLKDQADIFEESASERMQNRMKDAANVLEANSNGWVMLIYPATPSTYDATDHLTSMNCGYAYAVKFKDGKVTAMSERDYTTTDTTFTAVESTYKITNDEGPVLSFDTFNSILHYWSTPSGSSSGYQGRGGDFEFVIDQVSNDYIRMTGKRWKIQAEMFPITTGDMGDYLKSILRKKAGMSGITYGVTAGSEKVEGYLYETNGTPTSGSSRYLRITLPGEDGKIDDDDERIKIPFAILPDRCRLYQPMEIGEYSFQEFTLDNKTNEIKVLDSNDITWGHPFSYLPKEKYVGNYTLTYNKSDDIPSLQAKTINVSIALDDDGTLQLKGLNDKYDIPLEFDEWKGVAQIAGAKNLGQVETNNNGFARFCFCDSAFMEEDETFASRNYFYYRTSKSVMIELIWNQVDANNPYFRLESHNGWAILSGAMELHLPDGFYLHAWKTATGTGSSADYGALDLASGLGFNTGAKDEDGNVVGSRALPYVYSLTKK